jgi:hypothetical protein
MGKRHYSETIVERIDPRGGKYYWIGGDDLGFAKDDGTDCMAVHEEYISVTPLQCDMTDPSIAQQTTDRAVSVAVRDAMSEQDEPIRIDKWLWAARFYKTRSLAAEAVNGGKVEINDGRAKPSRAVRVGDKLCIHRGPL